MPGLTVPSLVSLQPADANKFYLRHERLVFHARKQPKGNSLCDAAATFRMLRTANGKIRFEASNYPGTFISVNESGTVILSANPSEDQATFASSQ